MKSALMMIIMIHIALIAMAQTLIGLTMIQTQPKVVKIVKSIVALSRT